MMMTATTRADQVSAPTRVEVNEARRAELDLWLPLLDAITDAARQAPTACERWDVHDLVCHLVGQASDIARITTYFRRDRQAKDRHPELSPLDGHMEVQVEEFRQLPPEEVRRLFDLWWGRADRAMRRTPGLLRKLSFDSGGVPGLPARVSLGYLHDSVYFRDLWMHRDDLARALGDVPVDAAHDALVVVQVVRDLDRLWQGPAVELELTGSGGGAWLVGAGTPVGRVRADTRSYLRCLAGRLDEPAVELVGGDEAAVGHLLRARVAF